MFRLLNAYHLGAAEDWQASPPPCFQAHQHRKAQYRPSRQSRCSIHIWHSAYSMLNHARSTSTPRPTMLVARFQALSAALSGSAVFRFAVTTGKESVAWAGMVIVRASNVSMRRPTHNQAIENRRVEREMGTDREETGEVWKSMSFFGRAIADVVRHSHRERHRHADFTSVCRKICSSPIPLTLPYLQQTAHAAAMPCVLTCYAGWSSCSIPCDHPR